MVLCTFPPKSSSINMKAPFPFPYRVRFFARRQPIPSPPETLPDKRKKKNLNGLDKRLFHYIHISFFYHRYWDPKKNTTSKCFKMLNDTYRSFKQRKVIEWSLDLQMGKITHGHWIWFRVLLTHMSYLYNSYCDYCYISCLPNTQVVSLFGSKSCWCKLHELVII